MSLKNKVLLALFIELVGAIGVIFFVTQSFSPKPPLPSRQIVENKSSLREIWRQVNAANVYPYFFPQSSSGSTSPTAIISISDRDNNKYTIRILNMETGQSVSEVILPLKIGWSSFIVRDDRLYMDVGYEADHQIQAYQLPEGRLLWATSGKPIDRSGYHLYWVDGQIVNYSTTFEKYQLRSVYDPNTGVLLQQTKAPVIPLLITDKFLYQPCNGDLVAIERKSGQEKWRTELQTRYHGEPILVGGYLLVTTREVYGSIPGLYLINASNGKRKWLAMENDLVSNSAVIDQTIYAINKNGDIVGLDLSSGIQTETIKFNPSGTDITQNSYSLISSGQILLVYYSDSQELIAFKRQ